MNTLAYEEIGDHRLAYPMPTFLVDGEDLVLKLLGDRILAFPGVGAVPANTNTFLAPATTVFHKIREGSKCRQVVLVISVGDAYGGSITASVERSRDSIFWSKFESNPETELFPAGPFQFDLSQYVEVLALTCFRHFRECQSYWPFNDAVLQSTWASEWPELSAQLEEHPRPEPAVRSWPRQWRWLPAVRMGQPWWKFW